MKRRLQQRIGARGMTTDSEQVGDSGRLDGNKFPHLADDETTRLQFRPAIAILAAEAITEVEHDFDTAVGKNALRSRGECFAMAGERPETLDVFRQCRARLVFPVVQIHPLELVNYKGSLLTANSLSRRV